TLHLISSTFRSFFYESGASSDPTKAGTPITVEYVAGTAPAVVTGPTATTVVEGEPAVFSAAISGEPAPSLQWQSRAVGESEWTDITGATAAELTIAAAEFSQDRTEVRVIAENAFGTVESAAAALRVQPAFTPEAPELTDE